MADLVYIPIYFISLLICIWTDYKSNKIKNVLVLILIVSYILLTYFLRGSPIGLVNILGLFIPFILLFPFFAMNYIGAGDIKLLMAIGFFLTSKYIIQLMLLTFLICSFYILGRKMLHKQRLTYIRISPFVLLSSIVIVPLIFFKVI